MRWSDLTPADVALVKRWAERTLSREDFQAYVAAPLSDHEREEQDGLLAWFAGRYPTPADRLRYARRTYARWTSYHGRRP